MDINWDARRNRGSWRELCSYEQHRSTLTTFFKYFLLTIIITSVLSGLILFWLTLIPVPPWVPQMLNKLWNCGVRIRDKRGDIDHVSSAYWSQSENTSAFPQVISHELGAGGRLPSDPSGKPCEAGSGSPRQRGRENLGRGVFFCATPHGGRFLGFPEHSWSLECQYNKYPTETATQEAMCLPPGRWIPYPVAWEPVPLPAPRIWPLSPLRVGHVHCVLYASILPASVQYFLLLWSPLPIIIYQPQYPLHSWRLWASGLKVFLTHGSLNLLPSSVT